jgi:hypothetical protein
MKRTLIPYSHVQLADLDANTGVVTPAGWDEAERIYAVPGFIIIGAQRCGTTALHRWLSVHPNLQTIPLELQFFNETTDLEADWKRYVLNPYFYLRTPETIHCTFEKTPDYLDKRNADGVHTATLVKKMMPSGKFIVLLRDPVERAHSVYKLRIRQKASRLKYTRLADGQLARIERMLSAQGQKTACEPPDDIRTFQETVTRMLDAASHSGFTREDRRMLTVGHYAEHLAEWFKHFPREQILVLFYEEFLVQPFETMDRILAFLDAPHIDYRTICERRKGSTWEWELIGYGAMPDYRIFDEPSPDWVRAYQSPMESEVTELLQAYFRPWNQRLADLLPEHRIPWQWG